MRKFVFQLFFCVICLLFALPATSATPIFADPSAITFHGMHCQNLTARDIEVDSRGRLYFDLGKMEASRVMFEKRTCMINIPYSADTDEITGDVTLAGVYNTPGLDEVVVTVRVSSSQITGKANFTKINDSPTGKFELRYPYDVVTAPGANNKLKIFVSVALYPTQAIELESNNRLKETDNTQLLSMSSLIVNIYNASR